MAHIRAAPDLIIEDDEALTPAELAAKERRRAWEREYRRRRYQEDPEYRERQKAAVNAYRRRNRTQPLPEARVPVLYRTSSLHSLACWGPTKALGCRCKKIIVREWAGRVDRGGRMDRPTTRESA